MIKQMYGLSALFVVFCAFLIVRPGPKIAYTEKDMERVYPDSLGDYHMIPDPRGENPRQSYKADVTTYRALVPYGIVSRVLTNGKRSFEVVVIAGDQPDTFHNPLVCFASQDYKVLRNDNITLKTQSRGDVSCILAIAKKGDMIQSALYTYEGPTKMSPENTGLHNDMFLTQLQTGRPQSATFFRFMTEDSKETPEDLEAFAVRYLDAAPVRPKINQS
jgi:hypothetical protein